MLLKILVTIGVPCLVVLSRQCFCFKYFYGCFFFSQCRLINKKRDDMEVTTSRTEYRWKQVAPLYPCPCPYYWKYYYFPFAYSDCVCTNSRSSKQ